MNSCNSEGDKKNQTWADTKDISQSSYTDQKQVSEEMDNIIRNWKKIQIKATVRYYTEKTISSIGGDVEQPFQIYAADGNVKWYNNFEKHLTMF